MEPNQRANSTGFSLNSNEIPKLFYSFEHDVSPTNSGFISQNSKNKKLNKN